jgi:hypothetical protein
MWVDFQIFQSLEKGSSGIFGTVWPISFSMCMHYDYTINFPEKKPGEGNSYLGNADLERALATPAHRANLALDCRFYDTELYLLNYFCYAILISNIFSCCC